MVIEDDKGPTFMHVCTPDVTDMLRYSVKGGGSEPGTGTALALN